MVSAEQFLQQVRDSVETVTLYASFPVSRDGILRMVTVLEDILSECRGIFDSGDMNFDCSFDQGVNFEMDVVSAIIDVGIGEGYQSYGSE